LAIKSCVRAIEIVEVLPLLELGVEELAVVHDDALEHPVELFVVDAVGASTLLFSLGVAGLMQTCRIPRSSRCQWKAD